MQKLLAIDKNAKTVKGQKKNYMTAIMYLAPSDESGAVDVCPFASPGCKKACLNTSGHGRFQNVQDARIKKTLSFAEDKQQFLERLEVEITAAIKKARKAEMTLAVRLNGTSDIAWEAFKFKDGKNLMELFPDTIFYDYTAIPSRAMRYGNGQLPANYHLTFSRKETEANHKAVEMVAKSGGNIAVVFSNKNYPETYLGLPVVNGDEDDLRFLDPKGVVVGLYAKADAKKDETGFVVQLDNG